MTGAADPTAAVEAVWRLEAARIVAGLARLVRDVGLAEELAQDALVAALEEWPGKGVPANPGGWLMLTAKHRAIDRLRRETGSPPSCASWAATSWTARPSRGWPTSTRSSTTACRTTG